MLSEPPKRNKKVTYITTEVTKKAAHAVKPLIFLALRKETDGYMSRFASMKMDYSASFIVLRICPNTSMKSSLKPLGKTISRP